MCHVISFPGPKAAFDFDQTVKILLFVFEIAYADMMNLDFTLTLKSDTK